DRARRGKLAQLSVLVFGEKDVAHPLRAAGAEMNAAHVHRVDPALADERTHRRDVTGEQNTGPRIVAIARERSRRIGRAVEVDVHLRGHAHAIELLLPLARRHFVVHENYERDVQRLPPTYDDLSVNQAVIDAVEHEGHAVAPWTVIAARPRSA